MGNAAEFRFLTIKCKTCGYDFIVTPSEQKWFFKNSLSIPVHCLECRQKRKQARINGSSGER
jgi:Probable zinc-ribbon domain